MAQLAALGQIIGAAGTLAGGNAAQAGANFEANQMIRNAGQVRASSQRSAAEQRRNADLVASRALAVSAASGAGTGGNVEDIMGDIAKEGEYRALTALFEGEQQATGMETAASVRKWEGKAAKRASRVAAAGTLLEAGSSMYGKYGGGGAPGATPSSADSGYMLSSGNTAYIKRF